MSLEVKVLSASQLKDVKTIGQQSPYVEVNLGTQQKLTRVATHGGRNPVWDDVFRFELGGPEWANEVLRLRILGDGTFGRAKVAGLVNIRLRDLVHADGSMSERPHFGAYQVFRPGGRPQGVLNVALSTSGAPPPAQEAAAPATPPGVDYSRTKPWQEGSTIPGRVQGYPARPAASSAYEQSVPYQPAAAFSHNRPYGHDSSYMQTPPYYQNSAYPQQYQQQFPPQSNIPYFPPAPQTAYQAQQNGRYGGGMFGNGGGRFRPGLGTGLLGGALGGLFLGSMLDNDYGGGGYGSDGYSDGGGYGDGGGFDGGDGGGFDGGDFGGGDF
jgi:hypothetical protein